MCLNLRVGGAKPDMAGVPRSDRAHSSCAASSRCGDGCSWLLEGQSLWSSAWVTRGQGLSLDLCKLWLSIIKFPGRSSASSVLFFRCLSALWSTERTTKKLSSCTFGLSNISLCTLLSKISFKCPKLTWRGEEASVEQSRESELVSKNDQ